jgi:protein ImuA
MAASARDIIEGLREQIRRIERRPPTRAGHASSGREDVDALLPGGGFPRGALSELAGGPASGKTALAISALAAAMGEAGLGAYVDGRGELYPPAAAALGLDLARLLVVRPTAGHGDPWSTLWASEALLGSGAFEAVVLDIPATSQARAPGGAALDTALQRLRAAAEKGGAVALWLSPPDGPRVPAALRLDLAAGRGGNEVRRAFARGSKGGLATARVSHAA